MADAAMSYQESIPSFRKENAPAKGYTYKNYLSWGEEIHCELINGMPYMMAAPGEWHQRVTGEVFFQLKGQLKDKPCRAYIAPFDVRLFPQDNESDMVVVQPDVLVVCDSKKLSDGRACKGAPDFVVEVVSKGSRGKDFGEKKNLYEKSGVRELWLIDRDALYKNILIDGKFAETVIDFETETNINVEIFPGCNVDFRDVLNQTL